MTLEPNGHLRCFCPLWALHANIEKMVQRPGLEPRAKMQTQTSLAEELAAAIRASDEMFGMLTPEGLYQRPIPLRHQSIFYYGHLPAFAWNQVFRGALGRPSFNPQFDSLFERGIDPPDTGKPAPPNPTWPDFADIQAYKQRIEHELFSLVANE